MKVNIQKTRDRMDVVSLAKWARKHGFIEASVRRVLCGIWNPEKFHHPVAKGIIDALRADGYLVEDPDDPAVDESNGPNSEFSVHDDASVAHESSACACESERKIA